MKKLRIVILALAIMLALSGVAMAAVLPDATTETNGILSDTVIRCDNIVYTSNNYAAEQSNQVLNGAPLAAKEVYGASTYGAQMVALNGDTTLVKTVKTNTKNQVIGGKNIDVNTDLLFAGNNGGYVTGTETVAQFNAGQSGTKAADVILCPFGAAKDTTIPPFNEAVIIGSAYDMYYGKVATQAGVTTTAATADVPTSTQYAINAEGAGSISTYMNVFAQDARGDGKYVVTPAKVDKCGKVTKPAVYSAATPSAIISYQEKAGAIGQFTFAKTLGYTSGIVG